MSDNHHSLEVQPRLPEEMARLEELANNLYYSWDRRTRGLFHRIDPVLWSACSHNPRIFLRRVSQSRLDELTTDPAFRLHFKEVLNGFDNYLAAGTGGASGIRERDDEPLVAYFCMEYGLHESLHLYSGGLGILAGDHCKAASDLDMNFVAVGLLYRQGYFIQQLGRDGSQEMHYQHINLVDIPVTPALDAAGQPVRVHMTLPGREVTIAVWRLAVGRLNLYLLDTELPENSLEDRAITHQLYGGDRSRRIAQELVLGFGGPRALWAMGIRPAVWHVNEGHPAFLILERCRKLVGAGMSFAGAFEAVAAATVFTTHTAAAAGHDLFSHELIRQHLHETADALGIDLQRLLQLGASPRRADSFNMTALALRGSRFHNGVSAVHRDVAARMESHIWPDIAPEDNPITSIPNGVHVATFLAREWVSFLDGHYPEWRQKLQDTEFWRRTIQRIPDHRFWSLTRCLKSDMLEELRERMLQQYTRNHYTRARIEAMRNVFCAENIRPLVIGFARRFATYKRALLIFQDSERLGRLLANPERPVIILFAGKAHPQDAPGQTLIRCIHEFASRPPFQDRVFLIEGYDMALARKLVTGVDVWLNTPEYPMEASGTSGQKAAINGVINLSVLDGWWAEGYDGENGWAVAPHGSELAQEERDITEAEDLLDLLEHDIIPAYFRIGPGGYSPEWVQRSKRSMFTVLPRFNTERMVRDYSRKLYRPAAAQSVRLLHENGSAAEQLASWKQKVQKHWDQVSLSWNRPPPEALVTGQRLELVIEVALGALSPEDVTLECLLSLRETNHDTPIPVVYRMAPTETDAAPGIHRFELDVETPDNGLYGMRFRLYPSHELLSHPFETGRMLWL
ncbi:MAG: alpha-glucan family phosphorylase [Pseudomonadota bacterium]